MLFRKIVQILSDSEYHKDWGKLEYDQLIFPALENGKSLLIMSEDEQPLCFCTWAFLSEKAASEYADGYGLCADDFVSDEGEFWMIDFVAPYGNCAAMVRIVREYMKDRYGPGLPVKIFRPLKKHLGTMYTAR